eukprot:PLAT203.1.p1 GENE.PLAT203.1~~PLAT203.1.p1  ORF type:complete len:483 (-),score=169.43 PLAT203.1:885-2309(-)
MLRRPSSIAARTAMQLMAESGTRCPCHGGGTASHAHMSSAHEEADYAFEMATSTVRCGPGVTREVGADMALLHARRVGVVTDGTLRSHPAMDMVLSSLNKEGIAFDVFDNVRVEPNDVSMRAAIDWAQAGAAAGGFDAFIALGGGSVMDTAKVANLYSTFPDADFMDFVNAPIGKGLPIPGPVAPMIAIPTTSGTGSETTGTAILDFADLGAKSGIASRLLRPTLGLVDPLNTATMPREVAISSGFDVLCHALESFTATPFNQRTPRPSRPDLRPAYQGSNPISDVWARSALESLRLYFERAVNDPEDLEAGFAVLLASSAAGIGFGNAGVHLPHGMSYPVSSAAKAKGYHHPGYSVDHAIVPHGVSVVMHAPAVFEFTAATNPERHLEAAGLLGADVEGKSVDDAGAILRDTVLRYMDVMDVPNGLSALGFTTDDLPELVAGTLPQHRVTKLAPKPAGADELEMLFERSMTVY